MKILIILVLSIGVFSPITVYAQDNSDFFSDFFSKIIELFNNLFSGIENKNTIKNSDNYNAKSDETQMEEGDTIQFSQEFIEKSKCDSNQRDVQKIQCLLRLKSNEWTNNDYNFMMDEYSKRCGQFEAYPNCGIFYNKIKDAYLYLKYEN